MKNTLYVLVKKYYDKTYGNTYHSVQTEINDNILHSGITYGYERQYEQTLKEILPSNKNYNIKYIVIDNCKKRELKEIHKYK